MIDREWVDGDDAELENQAYSAGFTEGKESLSNDMLLMLSDLGEALREEMEVHDEPSQHLVESVRSWSVRLHELGFITDDERNVYLSMTGEED
jgi:hypothetical protein